MVKTKRVLFIAPEYFNYCVLIKTALERLGASVDLFYNRPTSKVSKLFFVFAPKLYEKIKNQYFKKLLIQTAGEYKYILIIRADLIPSFFLERLKVRYPDSIFIQYIWDDIHLFPKLLDSLKYFNRVLSYELADCKKYGLVFRPFFFVDQQNFKRDDFSRKRELFFVGSYHSDRLKVLEKIKTLNTEIDFYSHFYIHPVTFLTNKIPFKKRSLFRFRKLDYSTMIDMIIKSSAILDIQNVSQNGLTTRIFEALGARSKIVTTNTKILDYEFYNDNNILIVDRNNPVIDKKWIASDYVEYDKDLLNNYHINSWIKVVFDIDFI